MDRTATIIIIIIITTTTTIIIIIIIIVIIIRNTFRNNRFLLTYLSLVKVFGLPDVGEKRHQQVPPQFMTDLYNNIADQSGFTRRRSPYNATVIRSFIERGK
jgi:hypothetical protein